MKTHPLVSVITPCYNGEVFLNRYFSSVLDQTYPNVELIFVNDGSTDRTEEIALSYKPSIEAKGYSFVYIKQENAGAAAALNQGLAIFKGDYLTWPDSDDWMTPDSIEKKVDFLEKHREYGFVFGRVAVFNENDTEKCVFCGSRKHTDAHWIFEDLIKGDDVIYADGCYMFRSDAFLEVQPNRRIYESKGGQNWQMLLPMSYYHQCGFLDEIVYNCLYRANSHSRQSGLEKQDLIVERYIDIVQHTLSEFLPKKKVLHYLKVLKKRYLLQRLFAAYRYGTKKEYNKRLVKFILKRGLRKDVVVWTLCKNFSWFEKWYAKHRKEKVQE